jgi:hypothetical protein
MSDAKVVLTPAAADVVRRVKETQEGRELSLVIGNGRCDSVVVDASDDPQPDSFSCEAELGFRFFLDRLPAV